jgi:hypothetical protein
MTRCTRGMTLTPPEKLGSGRARLDICKSCPAEAAKDKMDIRIKGMGRWTHVPSSTLAEVGAHQIVRRRADGHTLDGGLSPTASMRTGRPCTAYEPTREAAMQAFAPGAGTGNAEPASQEARRVGDEDGVIEVTRLWITAAGKLVLAARM